MHVGKETQGHLVEWVEKSSLTCLNKLFEIDQIERNHNVLLTKKNLKVILSHPKPFVNPIFPWLALPTLVLGEHFVLKDLPFYKVS